MFGALALVLGACGDDDAGVAADADGGDERPVVIATTSILGDIVGSLVDDDAEVEVLMPPGADPHDFEPSAQQAARLRDADLVVANGLTLEIGLAGALESAADDGATVLEVGELVDTIEFGAHDHDHGDDDHGDDDHGDDDHGDDDHGDDDHDHGDDDHGDDDHDHGDDDHGDDDHDHGADDHGDGDHDHGDDDHGDDDHDDGDHGDGEDDHGDDDHDHGDEDPHFWHDPARTAEAVPGIADALVEAIPSLDAEVLDERADALVAELLAVDAEVEDILAAVSDDRRYLITNHDSFGYLADRYDFEVIGTVIPGGDTLAAASAGDLADLVAEIEAHDLPAIFAENTVAAGLTQTLADEASVDVEVVTLYTDSLGEPGSDADTYVAMLRTNAQLIADALG